MYTVYMHITPSNKRYVGITSKSVEKRFGSNGCLYRNQIFDRAIRKYGWNNIEHIIVQTNLTKEQAKQLEIELIAKYDTTNPKFGYNLSIGGDIPIITGQHHTDETKQKIGKSNSCKVRTEETKRRISNSVKELWKTEEYKKKQSERVISEGSKLKMSEAHKGKRHTKEQIEKIRLGNLGKHQSEETKRLLSDIVRQHHLKEKELGIKRNYNNDSSKTADTRWYNNGIINIRSKTGCPEGFVFGRLKYSYPKNRKSRKVPSFDDAEPTQKTEKKVREVKKQFSGDKEDVF